MAAPACTPAAPATYCYNGKPCYFTPDPDIPKAANGDVQGIRWCYEGYYNGSSLYWSPTQTTARQAAAPVNTAQEARSAIGNLRLPAITLAFSPVRRAIVNLDTFFAPSTPAPTRLTGTSALGLIAVATLRDLTVNPGDTTPAFTCPAALTLPPPTATSSPCSHKYQRSSTTQPYTVNGDPAYAITANATYTVTYRLNATPITIPGAPTTVTTPATTTYLPVAEVQILSD